MTEATTPPKRRRPRGSGSIYKIAPGRYRGALVYSDPDSGTRRRKVVAGRSEGEVRDKLNEVRAELARTGRPASRMTLADYLRRWLQGERDRVRPTTWMSRQLHVARHITPAIGGLSLARVRPSDVERMTSSMVAAGLAGRTARHVRATLRRALADAQRDGLVAQNVAALARPPRVEPRELHILTAEETSSLIRRTADDPLGTLWAVAALTGMRAGELLGLRWSDVDLHSPEPTLTVNRTLAKGLDGKYRLAEPKTARSRRSLALGPSIVNALERQWLRQEEQRFAAGELWQNAGLVFADRIGRPLSIVAVDRVWQETLARLGLPRVRLHDLRHGAASLMLRQGVPLLSVSRAMGHSSIATTSDVYGHIDAGQRREAAEAMERALGDAK